MGSKHTERNWLREMEVKRKAKERIQQENDKKLNEKFPPSQRRKQIPVSSNLDEDDERLEKSQNKNLKFNSDGVKLQGDAAAVVTASRDGRRSKILINDSFVVERFKLTKRNVEIKGSSEADAWWNSTLNKPKVKTDLIWASWMGEPNDEERALVEAYGRKPVRGGYRGFSDRKASDRDSQSFEGVMKEYSIHAKMHEGKSNDAAVRRPDHLEDPKEALRWINTLKSIPIRISSSRVEERVDALKILADMTEDITKDEAVELLEKDVVRHLILIENESTAESVPNGIYMYLRSSKTGSDEQAARYLFLVHICLARIFRNIFCIFSGSYDLLPKDGNPNNDGIRYDWLIDNTATLCDILIQHPGVYRLLIGLFGHESIECKLHAAIALIHVSAHSDKSKQLLLETSDLLDLLLESTVERSGEIQEAAVVLLNDLLYCTRAKKQLYGCRAPSGRHFMSLVTSTLCSGTDKTKETAAWIIWALADDRISESKRRSKKFGASAQGDELRTQRTNLRGAAEWLGDEYQQDVVKHKICREAGLVEGLSELLVSGPPEAQEAAAAAVWCLAIERGNKRRLGLQPGVVQGLSAILKSPDSSADARRYASNAIRNLGTDPVALSYISAEEPTIVDHLMKDCDLSEWQVVQFHISHLAELVISTESDVKDYLFSFCCVWIVQTSTCAFALRILHLPGPDS